MKLLHIEKFKCFTSVDVPLNQLTLFVGANGFGKSTSIQSLLLLKNALDSKNEIVYLNDVYGQNLGETHSVFNKRIDDNNFLISIKENEESEDEVLFSPVSEDSVFSMTASVLKRKNLDGNFFYYLSAERVGPRISQPLAHLDYPNVGIKGEHTAQVIESYPINEKLPDERCFPTSKNKHLQAQVNEWIKSVFPGVKIVAKKSTETLTAQFLIGNEFSNDNFATNIGFGISYALPVIVTCLVAKKDSFVVIENPEAHLHPAAQAAMGRFLATMSKAGLNIIVETHSDHILEGIQLFVAENRGWNEKVSINCFSKGEGENQPFVKSISFNQNAEFSDWPDGFMDQSQKNFVELRKIRAKK